MLISNHERAETARQLPHAHMMYQGRSWQLKPKTTKDVLIMHQGRPRQMKPMATKLHITRCMQGSSRDVPGRPRQMNQAKQS